jgi:hypothetical protein
MIILKKILYYQFINMKLVKGNKLLVWELKPGDNDYFSSPRIVQDGKYPKFFIKNNGWPVKDRGVGENGFYCQTRNEYKYKTVLNYLIQNKIKYNIFIHQGTALYIDLNSLHIINP